MSTQAIRLRAEALRSLAFGSISSTYTAIGSKFAHPTRIMHLQNLTNADIVWSMDGITDHGVIASGGFLLLDVVANKTLDQGQFISEGTIMYAKSSGDPTSGSVYLSVFYGSKS